MNENLNKCDYSGVTAMLIGGGLNSITIMGILLIVKWTSEGKPGWMMTTCLLFISAWFALSFYFVWLYTKHHFTKNVEDEK